MNGSSESSTAPHESEGGGRGGSSSMLSHSIGGRENNVDAALLLAKLPSSGGIGALSGRGGLTREFSMDASLHTPPFVNSPSSFNNSLFSGRSMDNLASKSGPGGSYSIGEGLVMGDPYLERQPSLGRNPSLMRPLSSKSSAHHCFARLPNIYSQLPASPTFRNVQHLIFCLLLQ